jgi:hypothetical protein
MVVTASRSLSGLRRPRALAYGCVAVGILVWTSIIVYAAAAVLPVDIYLSSYYVADYTFGFVRRGLAGAIVGTVSGENFFDNARMVRWLITGVYVLSLAGLVRALLGKPRSERKTMLALLIPALPFGVPYAVYSARPELLGAAALVGLSLSLTVVTSRQWASACCGAYGLLVAVLVFMHEGIVFEFALGAILAILVLAQDLTPQLQRLCVALALCPGLAAALAVVAFARHDVSERLCSIVPHVLVENPFGGVTSLPQLIDNIASGGAMIDYHDWVCGWYVGTYDYSFVDGVKEVAAIGLPGLLASFLLGLSVIAVSIGAISYFSGVRFGSFVGRIGRNGFAWPALGLVLMIPVFMTGIDWTRWLLVVGFNIAIVYILYVRDRPEITDTPTPRTRRSFVLVVLGFALIPLGLVPGGPLG